MKFKFSYIFLAFLLSLTVFSCADDPLTDPNFIGEGESEIKAEVYFTLPNSALSRAVSGGTAGNAIENMTDICVLVYAQNGECYGKYFFKNVKTESTDATPSDVIKEESQNPNDEGEHRAEKNTVKATLTIPNIAYGLYNIYAVANVPEEELTDEVVSKIENVKNIALNWNAGDVAKNDQMFGYFSSDNKSRGFDASSPLVINKPSISIHAWVKRVVSKVTIAFDARNLNDNIYIYLKTAEIKDIPAHCYLGKDNEPGHYTGDAEDMNELIKNGQTIKYVEDTAATNYNETWTARISKGKPIFGFNTAALGTGSYASQIAAQHGENVNALYFFENMQGEGTKGTASDKWQVVEGKEGETVPSYPNGNTEPDGTPAKDPNVTGFKDAKPYGTYIEVKAYYVSNNSGDISRGNIIYRFMLGKDTHLDYNAERNHHYKLTMRFNGYANDVDWHIVYPREPGMEHPAPYYISYLYNHSMGFPVQVNTAPGVRVTGLSATITSNNWAPKDAPHMSAGFPSYWYPAENPTLYPWNGFLSLHQVETQVITADSPWAMNANQATYESAPKRGVRTYFSNQTNIQTGSYTRQMNTGAVGNVNASDKYSVKVEGSESNGFIYKFELPMYTRAKQMIKQTGFTGNNPYSAYEREAIVHITATLSNGETYQSDVPIRQVPRCVNPKGIYRTAASSKTFNVVMKKLKTEEGTNFEDIISDGPWRAYVLLSTNGDNVCTLSGNSETTTTKTETIEYSESDADPVRNITVKSIYGRTGAPIDFDVNFKANTEGDAIIRVEYNNYSCTHLIFVKKGDKPVQLVDGGVKWHVSNMTGRNTIASNPCEEGSLFKWNNWTGIPSNLNKNGKSPWVNVVPDDFIKNAAGQSGQISVDYWNNIAYTSNRTGGTFTQTTLPNSRMATYNDYKALNTNQYIEQGYGVLYSDAASTTKDNIIDAYEYDNSNTNRGMRGCFVYNKKTGANVFFPVGASGYGHRKATIYRPTSGVSVNPNAGPTSSGLNPVTPTTNDTGTQYVGLLRYSVQSRWGYFNVAWGATAYPQAVNDAPLFYDIFKSAGAIYWLRVVSDGRADFSDSGQYVCGWDINYKTLDFYPITVANVNNGQDACFIRCVSTQ